MRMSIRISGRMPGRNEQEAAARESRFTASKLKKRWTGWSMLHAEAELKEYNRGHLDPWDPEQLYDVTCTWFEQNCKRDPDNISAGIKFVLDGIVAAGILSNDGWRNVGKITHEFDICKGNPGVLIDLEEVP